MKPNARPTPSMQILSNPAHSPSTPPVSSPKQAAPEPASAAADLIAPRLDDLDGGFPLEEGVVVALTSSASMDGGGGEELSKFVNSIATPEAGAVVPTEATAAALAAALAAASTAALPLSRSPTVEVVGDDDNNVDLATPRAVVTAVAVVFSRHQGETMGT